MTMLIDLEQFHPVFKELIGQKVAFVGNPGKVGDQLIADATMQLFRRFNINFQIANRIPFQPDQSILAWADHIVYGGGGSMGPRYRPIYNLRQSLLGYGKPVTVFPQSFFLEKEEGPFHRVWVRERKSLEFCADALLAPDLALGFSLPFQLESPFFEEGVFLRKDTESTPLDYRRSMGDPYLLCKSIEELFTLVAQFKTIYTNRLHFAIAGLIAKREVILLPNSYFKNEAIFKAWLQSLGCKFSHEFPKN